MVAAEAKTPADATAAAPFTPDPTTSNPATATAAATAAAAAEDPDKGYEVKQHEATGAGPIGELPPFNYGWRAQYMTLVRHWQLGDFFESDFDQTVLTAHTFKHPCGTRVTLVPMLHLAHPQFYQQVDAICAMHHSVLSEGRYSALTSPTSVVPPREPVKRVRPIEEEDSEGWEPASSDEFFQPFSFGVRGSVDNTVIHAADKYDYEVLPWWASTRFNMPLLGMFQREKHCLDLMQQLSTNGYQTFAVPWGAAHMPIFATMLEKNEFELVGTSRLIAFNRIDGLISAGWVRQWRMRLRTIRWFWGAARLTPCIVPIGLIISFMEDSVYVRLPRDWFLNPEQRQKRQQEHDRLLAMEYQKYRDHRNLPPKPPNA